VKSLAVARESYETGTFAPASRDTTAPTSTGVPRLERRVARRGLPALEHRRVSPAVRVPSLVIQGRTTPTERWPRSDAIERGSGGPVTRLVLPGCGHAPHRTGRKKSWPPSPRSWRAPAATRARYRPAAHPMTRLPRYALALLAGMVLGLGSPPVDAYLALWLGLVASPGSSRVPRRPASGSLFRVPCAGWRSHRREPRSLALHHRRRRALHDAPLAAAVLALVLLSIFEGCDGWWPASPTRRSCGPVFRGQSPSPRASTRERSFDDAPVDHRGLVSRGPRCCSSRTSSESVASGADGAAAGLAASGVRAALRPTTRKGGLLEMGAALVLVLAQVRMARRECAASSWLTRWRPGCASASSSLRSARPRDGTKSAGRPSCKG